MIFPFQLHIAALRLATPRQARWIVAELALCAGLIGLTIVASQPLLLYQVVSMTMGQMLSGFFAVWTVHHDCDRWQQIARTLRHRLKSAASFACSTTSSTTSSPGTDPSPAGAGRATR